MAKNSLGADSVRRNDVNSIELAILATTTPAISNSADPIWNARLARYLELDALQKGDLAFGAYAIAMQAGDHKAEDVRRETYLEPLWTAARELIETPAPNLPAAMFKAEVMRREDAFAIALSREPMEILADDLARPTAQPETEPQSAGSRSISLEDDFHEITYKVSSIASMLELMSDSYLLEENGRAALGAVCEWTRTIVGDVQEKAKAAAASGA